MISQIRDKIIAVKEAVGVDIHFMEDGGMFISGVQLKIQNGNVNRVKVFDSIYSLEELKSKLPANIPLAISLNGKGVIMRTVAEKVTDNLISKMFPGTNPQNFVTVIHQLKGKSESIIYVTRKAFVEKFIRDANDLNLRIVSMTIGTKPVDIVIPFISTSSLIIWLPSLSIDIDQSNVNAVYAKNAMTSNDDILRIADNTYKPSQVLALGNAMGILSKPADMLYSDIAGNEITEMQTEHAYYKLFSFIGWTILLCLLTLLLANFIVFNSYYNKKKNLESESEVVNSELESKTAVNMEIDSLYNFFVRAGWNVATKHGYYIDRIAALVPSSLQLTGIQSSPLNERSDIDDFAVKSDQIILMGVSVNPIELEIFIRAIKNVPGIKIAELTNYLYKENLHGAIFTIEITYQ